LVRQSAGRLHRFLKPCIEGLYFLYKPDVKPPSV